MRGWSDDKINEICTGSSRAGCSAAERTPRSIALSDTRLDAAWQAAHTAEVASIAQMLEARAGVGADEPGRELGARRQMEARKGHDTWDRLPKFEAPVLVCGGRFDGIAPPENLRALASRLPNARLELFEGGHMFMLQDKRANERIVEFLKGRGIE